MKRINELNVDNKTIVLRCDYNVPINDGIIEDNSRIKKSLKTINYLLDHNCKIVILSHLGRVKSEEDKQKNSLKPVANELSKLLQKKVLFVSECYGNQVKEIVANAQLGDVILLENTRYMDYPEKLESGNNEALAKFWASLGDIFILDAFGSCHRAHASTAGIANYMESAIGFLIIDELDHLSELININKRPFTIFMGGAKVEDKLVIIKKLLPKCDYLLLGGGIANSFLKTKGIDVKTSLATDNPDMLNELDSLLKSYEKKIILPIDFVYDGESIMDLGNKTIENYNEYLKTSSLIFMNGTPGKFEDERFAGGTKQLLERLSQTNATIIIGGGDTVSAVKKCGYEGKFYFESSGGGATLEYIADGELEALKWLK